MLELQIHSKRFSPEKDILRDIKFSARTGEILALLGPSGIGKSTILRIVAGLDQNFDGSVRKPPGRLGIMFQEPRLPPWLTVAGNLRLVRPDADVPALLREVMLPGAEQALPSSISLGMARRVALARAFAVDPDLLVLDEPFASLDQSLATTLGQRVVDRATRDGTTILLSSHDLDQALAVATRVLVLGEQPATLKADLPVPPRDDAFALRDLRRDLLGRFAFLGTMDTADIQ